MREPLDFFPATTGCGGAAMTFRAHRQSPYGHERLRLLGQFGVAGAAALTAGLLVPGHLAVAVLLALGAAGIGVVAAIGDRRTPVESFLAAGMILVSATTDLPQKFQIGPVTGLGALTVLFAIALVPYWILNVSSIRFIPLPFRLFLGWVAIAALVHPSLTMIGAQNILVFALFAWSIAVASHLTALCGERFVPLAGATLRTAGWAASALYAGSLALSGLGGHAISGARAFPPFALIILGLTLSRIRSERRSWLLATVLITFIALSLSRAGLAAAAAMVAVAWFNPRQIRSWLKTSAIAVVSLTGLLAAISNVPALHARFFDGDVQSVGFGVSINTTGRETIWRPVWNDYLTSPWIGHGPGTGDALVARLSGFAENAAIGVGNVHNDYLRVIHDYGLIGLLLWSATLLSLFARLQAVPKARDMRSQWPWAAFLALFGLALLMIVDNPMIEVDVMVPLGLVIGIGLAVAEGDEFDGGLGINGSKSTGDGSAVVETPGSPGSKGPRELQP